METGFFISCRQRHSLHMCSFPVCPSAGHAPAELPLCFVHLRWHHVYGVALLDEREWDIALGTTGEGIKARFKGHKREYLLDLFLHEIAFDEQMVRSKGPGSKSLI